MTEQQYTAQTLLSPFYRQKPKAGLETYPGAHIPSMAELGTRSQVF